MLTAGNWPRYSCYWALSLSWDATIVPTVYRGRTRPIGSSLYSESRRTGKQSDRSKCIQQETSSRPDVSWCGLQSGFIVTCALGSQSCALHCALCGTASCKYINQEQFYASPTLPLRTATCCRWEVLRNFSTKVAQLKDKLLHSRQPGNVVTSCWTQTYVRIFKQESLKKNVKCASVTMAWSHAVSECRASRQWVVLHLGSCACS